MNASNMHTIKLDKYTALDTVLKLDWQKGKDKEYMVVKIISVGFRLQYTFFELSGAEQHGSCYRE